MPSAASDRPPHRLRSSRLLALLAILASPAAGQGALTPGAFEAISEGQTLHFTHLGAPYGAEQFFAGRRSLWRHADGTCTEGRWWDEGEAICFRYADAPAPQCWRFLPRPGGLAAELVEGGAGTGFVVEMSHADAEPLPCPGPKVGS
ncbi:MAG TPA: hypothetical protein VJ797_06065 [Burkholderiales bacterium]|nr:hypothetical protein [Burkholderiales bacterium]